MESGLVTTDDMLPMGHCKVLSSLWPLQAERSMFNNQPGLPCGSIDMVTTGQEPVVDDFLTSPNSIQIPHLCHQGPGTFEAILSDHLEQNIVLTRCGLPRSPHGLAWYQSSSGSMPLEDAVDGSTSQIHVTSNNALRHTLAGKCKHFMPNTYRGWTEHY